ncbi:sensor histidine kinase [Parapedobacter sp. 10938]|uniref:sensor histidine kinase n=1 Tax=Parapedobacter flavus TaxID=3110225 RepID=UPI002DB73B3B|nr:7TM diverse intracellular signaling domain-containing protein [Parapedobacter sp. 10938]MEC3881341.1 7TM diverse intracellular signaling domain-containing protein [Parapedobacter sp. 10938]
MRRRVYRFFLLLFGYACSVWGVHAEEVRLVRIDASDTYSLNGYVAYYEDTTLMATPDDVLAFKDKGLFTNVNGDDYVSLGYTDSYYWVLIELENTLPDYVDLFLSIPIPSINRIDFYRCGAGDNTPTLVSQTGDRLPFAQRPWPVRDFLFPIRLAGHEHTTLLFKVDKRGQNFSIKAKLGKREVILQQDIPIYAAFGFYTGIFAFAFLFNVLMYLSVADRIHLYYALYILCSVILVLDEVGLAKEWFFSDVGRLHDYVKSSSGMLGCGLLIQVMQLFTNQTSANSKLYHLANYYKYLVYVLGILPFFAMLFPVNIGLEKTIFYVANISVILSLPLIAVCVIERIRRGFILGYYYLLAILPLIIGASNYILQIMGLVGEQLLKPNGITVGFAAEVVILSFALTQRYNFLKREKAQLKKENDLIRMQSVRQVFQAQEDERDRLAKDLHDDLGGTLSVIRLKVTDFQTKLDRLRPEEKEAHDETIRLITRACDDLREISHSLKPKFFLENGLIGTLQERLSILNRVSVISFEFVYQYTGRSDPEIELSIYRMVNELINNVVKHSCATQATIQLVETADELVVTVEDNGIGFDRHDSSEGIGLNNVYSRIQYLGGRCTIDSNKNGTTITLEIPLQNHGNQPR